jgi:AraC-like DNA-binding protein
MAESVAATVSRPYGLGIGHDDRVSTSAPAQTASDSVRIASLLLAVATEGGADARKLAREARVPTWAISADQAMIPYWHSMRLWELVEHALQDPNVALTTASRHGAANGSLFDYILATSATLRDGLRAAGHFFHLVTSNARLQVEAETESEITYSLRYLYGEGRGPELSTQFSVMTFCVRARTVTGLPVVPVHVGFAQPPPRTSGAFSETLRTRHVDFGLLATTFTFRADDLDLPLRQADPVLNRILTGYAPATRPPALSWHEHFQVLLTQQIERGDPTLAALARRLRVSSRTLQRQLAEHGTTWRAELDAARQRRVEEAPLTGAETMAELARRLSYSDARSVRRALRRWADRAGG